MKLTYEQIKSFACGAARTSEENGRIRLYRMTQEQEEFYKERNDFYIKALSTAGIKLVFKTDSKSLFMKVNISKGSTRTYFSHDVFVDGKMIGSLDNYSGMEIPQAYTTIDCPLGSFEKIFELGDGEKTVCIYFPWSVASEIEEVSIDDGAFAEAVKSEKTLLAFGDSITQGYDALKCSNLYMSRLSRMLGADEYNKAIGGEIFFPALAKTKEAFEPDYITVAYGTNDWSTKTVDEFKTNCREFYLSLSKNYPKAKIFAITPIWRKDYAESREFGDFVSVEQLIKELTSDLANVYCISGFDFVPHDENYFGDLSLHPNDAGFECYAKKLYEKMKEYI